MEKKEEKTKNIKMAHPGGQIIYNYPVL